MIFADLLPNLTLLFPGQSMNNLANTYGALGRHQDALALLEKALDFFRRVLPQNHPHIAQSCYNVSFNLVRCGDLHRAVERAREAVRIWQATLPPSHKDVRDAQELVRDIERILALRT